VTTGGAALLAGGGVASFVLAGNALSSGQRQCAEVVSVDPAACSAQRNKVRGLDFAAAGMWVGAAGLAAVSVVLWTARGGNGSSALVIAPGFVGMEEAF
jgi:hypothetical protein